MGTPPPRRKEGRKEVKKERRKEGRKEGKKEGKKEGSKEGKKEGEHLVSVASIVISVESLRPFQIDTLMATSPLIICIITLPKKALCFFSWSDFAAQDARIECGYI